jgi:hypothetical protein
LAGLVQRSEEERAIRRRRVSLRCDGPPSLGAVGGQQRAVDEPQRGRNKLVSSGFGGLSRFF